MSSYIMGLVWVEGSLFGQRKWSVASKMSANFGDSFSTWQKASFRKKREWEMTELWDKFSEIEPLRICYKTFWTRLRFQALNKSNSIWIWIRNFETTFLSHATIPSKCFNNERYNCKVIFTWSPKRSQTLCFINGSNTVPMLKESDANAASLGWINVNETVVSLWHFN